MATIAREEALHLIIGEDCLLLGLDMDVPFHLYEGTQCHAQDVDVVDFHEMTDHPAPDGGISRLRPEAAGFFREVTIVGEVVDELDRQDAGEMEVIPDESYLLEQTEVVVQRTDGGPGMVRERLALDEGQHALVVTMREKREKMTDPRLRPFQGEERSRDVIVMLFIHEAFFSFRPTRQTAHGDQHLVRDQYMSVLLIHRHCLHLPYFGLLSLVSCP